MNELSSLHRRLGVQREVLGEDLARVADLRAVGARRAEIDALLGDLDRQVERLPRAAVITLVGATGAGKSTLLNALAGQRIAQEGVDRPTTRRPVVHAPADADVDEILTAISSPEHRPVVAPYTGGSGPWSGQILIDAPDLNSVDEENRAVVRALADRSDVLLVVLHHQSVVEERSVSFLDDFAGRRHLLFVLNRADELTAEARSALVEQVRRLATTRFRCPDARVVALSAREAQAHPTAPGWRELCAALHELVRDGALTGIRRANVVGIAGRLGSLFAEVRREIDADLAALPDEVARGVEQLDERCADEVATRLGLRHADLRAQLWSEAAKRWDGPGGLALRAGSLTSLGVGAGIAGLGRNPLAAAGAAAGALAADQVRDALRERRVADLSPLLPDASEFTAWFAEALAGARVRAARLTGSAEGLGLASAEALRSDLAGQVAESWGRLIERDLPDAAERSVLRFFRLLFDLPVYGLGAWAIWRVAEGVIHGPYAGVDFLVSVLVLLTAYLFVVRLVVRTGLSRRARALLATALTRTRERIAARGATLVAGVRDAADARRVTLGRLAAAGPAFGSASEAALSAGVRTAGDSSASSASSGFLA